MWGLALFVVCVALLLGVVISFWIVRSILTFAEGLFDAYPLGTRRVLSAVGDAPIRAMWVVRVPFSLWIRCIANVLTNYAYSRIGSPCDQPHHTAILCEIEVANGGSAFVLIDKDTRVHVRRDGPISGSWSMLRVPRLPLGRTIRGILADTRRRIGDCRFFNWSLHRYNCSHLAHQVVLSALGTPSCPKYLRRFIYGRGPQLHRELVRPNAFAVHVFHCIQLAYSVIEKYAMDTWDG